jgi:hypothetical protein
MQMARQGCEEGGVVVEGAGEEVEVLLSTEFQTFSYLTAIGCSIDHRLIINSFVNPFMVSLKKQNFLISTQIYSL